MPNQAPKLCRDCQKIATLGPYCSDHEHDNRQSRGARERERARRDSGVRRLYDSAQWRKRTRPAILARDPLCMLGIVCGGVAASTDVDHIVRADVYVATRGPRSFFDSNNLRGICHECHSHKTRLENAGAWTEPARARMG